METIKLKVGDVKPYERNAKKHDETQIKNVMESIKQFGFVQPIVVDKDNVLIIGHCRLIAAKRLQMREIDAVVAKDLTEEQANKLRLLDNKLNESDWDFDLLLEDIPELDFTGFDINWDLPEIDDPMEELEEDTPPEVPKIAKALLGDIYEIGRHRLICGDSTDQEIIKALLQNEKGNLLLTDPPYNCNYAGKNESLNRADNGNRIQTDILNDNLNDYEFLQFLEKAFNNIDKYLINGASFYIWCVDSKIHLFISAIDKAKWKWHQTLIWVKNNFVLGHLDYQKKHEPCLYGWKNGQHYFLDSRKEGTVIDDKIDLKKLKKDEMLKLLQEILSGKVSTTVIYENKPQINDLHPTMKPINLLARLIVNSTKKNDLVIDLFGGSGSTLIACEQLNRKCFMCELAPNYVDVIVQRYINLKGTDEDVYVIRKGKRMKYSEL